MPDEDVKKWPWQVCYRVPGIKKIQIAYANPEYDRSRVLERFRSHHVLMKKGAVVLAVQRLEPVDGWEPTIRMMNDLNGPSLI